MTDADRLRRDDLLCDRALGVLSPDEERELAALLAESPVDEPSFDLAVAAVVAASVADEAPPASLLAKLEADADAFAARAAAPRARPASAEPARRRVAPVLALFGWAAAAAFAIAFGLEHTRPPVVQVVSVSVPIPTPPPSSPPPTFAEQRARLLADGAPVLRIDWANTKDPASSGVSGDVVWSPTAQRGFMRFQGLAVNDPQKVQYQLWIFDDAQNAKYPIDGGVFDIDRATGDVLVPIVAKLPVKHATLFAITVEKPGGVVVSSRERLVLAAKVPAGLGGADRGGRWGGRRDVSNAAPWVLAAQTFRVGVEVALYLFHLRGDAPLQVTFEGRNVDILVGITAPALAWLVARGRVGPATVAVWNVLGLAVLANTMVTVSTSLPGALHLDWPGEPFVALATWPLVWLPSFLAPLAVFLHVTSLRQVIPLLRRGEAGTAASRPRSSG